MTEGFDREWLDLREKFDAAARSVALAERLAAMLPARPRILDLAAGTGSMFRWLAPRLGRAQAWLLVDADAGLVSAAFERTAEWAERRGWTVTWPARAMLVHAPGGTWRVEGFAADLAAESTDLPITDVDAVLCSALLDLVSRAWLDRLAESLRGPFLACLSVDGRNAWLPRHAADRLIEAGFRRHQANDKGFGPSLGVHAPHAAMQALGVRDFAVLSAPSDWRVPNGALTMLRTLVQGAAQSARILPGRHDAIADWERVRLRQTLAARLAVRIGHRDILSWPRKQ